MVRYHSEDLLRQHGFEEGLKLLNVLTARDLGMIPERRAFHFVRENVMLWTRTSGAKLSTLKGCTAA
jgi:hypothetical protein